MTGCFGVLTRISMWYGGFTGSTFLPFKPSEIAAAAALAAVSSNQVVGFESVLSASEIPVNKVSFSYHVQRPINATLPFTPFLKVQSLHLLFHSRR